jgi:polyhydroxyalkanoate synthase
MSPQVPKGDGFAEMSDKLLKAGKLLSSIKDEDVDVGATPKTLVMRRDKVELFRYTPLTEQKVKTPVLLAYGLMGRYTMADLQEDR